MQLIPPDRWNHVDSLDNPADCASRGLFPSELIQHELWWNSPDWLKLSHTHWPIQSPTPSSESSSEEERSACLHIVMNCLTPIIPFEHFLSFLCLKRITAWIRRFINNCRRKTQNQAKSTYLSTAELSEAENYWVLLTQRRAFPEEFSTLKQGDSLSNSSRLFTLHRLIRITPSWW